MPMIEIDTNAREILLKWKRIFGESIGARFDYSEAIRKADDYVVYPEYQDPKVRDRRLGRAELERKIQKLEAPQGYVKKDERSAPPDYKPMKKDKEVEPSFTPSCASYKRRTKKPRSSAHKTR